ncbi:MAG: hypothetical protein GY757_10845, partial [bacterium]|nr:hypothetical protein [bacterium]
MTFLKTMLVMAVVLCVMGNGLLTAGDSVAKIIAGKKLTQAYNGVLVDFLLDEGKAKLQKKQHKMALDQLVTALKAKTTVTKKEQLNTALGNLVGTVMKVSGGDVIGSAGADVESYYAGEWASWIDAAYKLAEAGYKEDAAKFFEYGIQTMPYPSLKARCVQGLAIARPDSAFDLLMAMLKEPTNEVKSSALRFLGHLAADKNCPADKKKAIADTLVKYSKGMKGDEVLHAVIDALSVCKIEEGKAILAKLKKGMRAKEVKRAAVRCLLMDYGDKSVIKSLEKMAKGGFMKDDSDKFFGGSLLIEIGEAKGFAYAGKALKYKKKGLLSTKKKGPDYQPAIVNVLVRYGGDKGKEVLSGVIGKYKDKLWIKTWMAVGLLELGDKSQMDFVKTKLDNLAWDFTALRIAEALAKHGDFAGIPVIKQLMAKRAKKLAGKAEVNRLSRLRVQIADLMQRLNHAQSVPYLIQLLGDEDQYVRSGAALALCKM